MFWWLCALVCLRLVCAEIATADDSTLKSAVLEAIERHYYRAMSSEDLKKNSLSEIIALLDKDSSLIDKPKKELDYVRGFKKRSSFLKSQMLDGKIGYLRIDSFSVPTVRRFKREYQELKAEGAKKIIFDLRHNIGGDFDSAVAIAELFVPEGQTLAVVRKRNGEHRYYSKISKPLREPLVILVGSGTASSAEFLAMILHRQGGQVVGTRTQGKSTIQQFFPVEQKWLCLTVGTWQKPDGTPESVPLIPEFLVSGESEQLRKAVELLKNDH